MEGVFSLPYSEYEVINQLQKKLKKSEGYSFYIPTSRQQKGIDFIIHNNKTNRYCRFQVKSSRSYIHRPKKLKSGKTTEVKYKYSLWFNNFLDRYEKDNADFYILFGLYPMYQKNKNIKSKTVFWKPLLMCFSENEMIDLLKQVRTKKEKKPDRFFGFAFNTKEQIFGTRGLEEDIDLSDFLLDHKYRDIKKILE